MTDGVFVSFEGFVRDGGGGGVQICTREYRDAIAAAGLDVAVVPFASDRRLATRILRRFNSSPYLRPAPPDLVDRIAAAAAGIAAPVVFLNQVALAGLVPAIKARLPGATAVLLSHGLESTDLLHLVRLKGTFPLSGRIRPNATIAMGTTLVTESRTRAAVDLVCALSPFDAALEGWIGARRVLVMPRVITPDPLSWQPAGDRVGFLGTLDHAPNLEGLVAVLEALAGGAAPEVRIVGGSGAIGRWLEGRFPFVTYLGPLADPETRREAATWSAFLHPIFCHARGCSTKLATALGWEIPIVTTTQGHRGYEWRDGRLLVADDPVRFAAETRRVLDPARAASVQEEAVRVARSSPDLAAVAGRLGVALAEIRA